MPCPESGTSLSTSSVVGSPATLAFNHGYAQAMWGYGAGADGTLKEARKLLRKAYGPDSKEVLQVEAVRLKTVADDAEHAPPHADRVRPGV